MEWIYREFRRVGKLLFEEGFVSARSGNLSFRWRDRILITRTGAFVGDLSREDIVSLPLRGESPLSGRASVELVVHRSLLINTARRAVVHAHPPNSVALSFSQDEIVPVDSEGFELVGRVRVVSPERVSASEELAEAVLEVLREDNIVVVRGHGVFSADASLFGAYRHISTLEHSCKILLLKDRADQEV